MSFISTKLWTALKQPLKDITLISQMGAGTSPQPGITPIFQMGSFPIPVVGTQYAGALSPTLPGGSNIPLRRFYNLVDRVPVFHKTYFPGPYSCDRLYGQFLNLSTLSPDAPVTANTLLSQDKNFYEQSKIFDNIGQGPGFDWRPHFPDSEDWWKFTDTSPTVRIDFEGGASGEEPNMLPGTEDIVWRLENFAGSAPLQPGSMIESISFKYRFVMLQRPWIDPLLWSFSQYFKIAGLPAGDFSTGSMVDNPGRFSLLPIGFLVAADVQIKAIWSGDDKSLTDLIRTGELRGSLGPFALGAGSESALQTREAIKQKLPSTLTDLLLKDMEPSLLSPGVGVTPLSFFGSHGIAPLGGGLSGGQVGLLSSALHTPLHGQFTDGPLGPDDGPIFGPVIVDVPDPLKPLPQVIIKLPPHLHLPLAPSPDPMMIVYPDPQIIGWISVLVPRIPN